MNSLINNTLSILTPLLLISTGALVTDLAGSLNIALEGLVTISALFSIIGVSITNSIVLGTLIGISSSMILAYILSTITSKLKANIFITGLATNLLATGICSVTTFSIYNTRGNVKFENLKAISKFSIGGIEITLFLIVSLILLALTYVFLNMSATGLRIRACGMDPHSLKSYGISRSRTKLIAFLISGFFCGMAGSYLSLNLGSYVAGISSGKGWIGLVIIYLAGSNIKYLLPAALTFAVAEALSIYYQGITNLPPDIVLALPSVFTLLVMVIVSIIVYKKNLVQR
ncbi:MAG: ABC transporter permease [Sphaerochaetaceae bacterium]|jgi:simple sugar transport system permease protein|nr:ABC transporter permease [Sphaerochaetaceae bacterium]